VGQLNCRYHVCKYHGLQPKLITMLGYSRCGEFGVFLLSSSLFMNYNWASCEQEVWVHYWYLEQTRYEEPSGVLEWVGVVGYMLNLGLRYHKDSEFLSRSSWFLSWAIIAWLGEIHNSCLIELRVMWDN